jgi:hypothetical protein
MLRSFISFAPLCASLLIGIFVGLTAAYLVGQSLIELALSEIFATAIGLFLLILGAILIWRVQQERPENSPGAKAQRYVVLAFGTLVLMSGTFCFILEKSWMLKLGPAEKIPMYVCLGVALSFAYVFSMIEIVNMCHSLRYQQTHSGFVPIISNTQQICINLAACIGCGCYFGVLFSLLDLDKESDSIVIHKDRLYTFPLGMIVGAIVGAANYFSAVQSATYDPLDINMI